MTDGREVSFGKVTKQDKLDQCYKIIKDLISSASSSSYFDDSKGFALLCDLDH